MTIREKLALMDGMKATNAQRVREYLAEKEGAGHGKQAAD